jgi:hypothetical protein
VRQQVLFEAVEGTHGKDRIETEATNGNGKELSETMGDQAVSPLANLSFRQSCAYCGRETGASGCIIPDFEELGAFCGQECADRRFRLYLKAEA